MGKVSRIHPEADFDQQLAPIQAHLLSRAERNNCTLDAALARLGTIIQSEDEAAALIGIRTLFDYTVGRPASNSKNLHVHAGGKSADKFFDKGVFETPPAPRLED